MKLLDGRGSLWFIVLTCRAVTYATYLGTFSEGFLPQYCIPRSAFPRRYSTPIIMTSSSSWTAETADWYATNFGEYATNRIAVDQLIQDQILATSSTGVVVVDIGCGTGCALRRVASKFSNVRLIGLEPTPRMLEIAKERAATNNSNTDAVLDLRPGGAEEIPLEDGIADVVLAFDVLDHVSDLRKALREIRRIMKPRTGYLAIVKDGGIEEGDDATKMERTLGVAKGIGFEVKDQHNLEEGEVTLALVVLRKTS